MTLFFFCACVRLRHEKKFPESHTGFWQQFECSMCLRGAVRVFYLSRLTRKDDRWREKASVFNDLFVRCTSGGSTVLHTQSQCLKVSDLQMSAGLSKNKIFFGVCFGLCVPQCALCLFSQICQCHLGLWAVLYPHCPTDKGVSGFVRVLRCVCECGVRANAGQLLCRLRTDLHRANIKFKPEGCTVCTHSRIIHMYSSWPSGPTATEASLPFKMMNTTTFIGRYMKLWCHMTLHDA